MNISFGMPNNKCRFKSCALVAIEYLWIELNDDGQCHKVFTCQWSLILLHGPHLCSICSSSAYKLINIRSWHNIFLYINICIGHNKFLSYQHDELRWVMTYSKKVCVPDANHSICITLVIISLPHNLQNSDDTLSRAECASGATGCCGWRKRYVYLSFYVWQSWGSFPVYPNVSPQCFHCFLTDSSQAINA